MSHSSAEKNVVVSIVLIMVIAAFFRFSALDLFPPGLYPDEAMNGNNALLALNSNEPEGGFKMFYPDNNGREGLFMNIIAVSISVSGNEPWAIRIVSSFFGLAAVLGVFLFARELFRDRAGDLRIFGMNKNTLIALTASFFLATNFWHIIFSRIGFRAIMAPAFLAWGLYFLWLIFREDFSHNKKALAVAAGGILFGLGFHSYIAYRVVPVLLIFPFLMIWKIRKSFTFGKPGCLWCVFTLFIFFVFITVLPLWLYYIDNPADFFGRTSQISIFSSENPLKILGSNLLKTLGMFWFSGDYNWRHNFAGAPQLFWPIGLLFALGIIVSVINIFSAKGGSASGGKKLSTRFLEVATSPEKFLGAWFFIGLFPVIFSAEGIPHALRAIIIIPPVMIISAIGFIFLAEKIKIKIDKNETAYPEYAHQLKRIRKEIVILFFVFMFALLGASFNKYFLRWGPHPDVYSSFSGDYVKIGKWLNEKPQEITKYVIINASGTEVRIPGSNKTLPMPAQTVMYITDTWTAKNQQLRNFKYLRPDEINLITCDNKCYIALLESDINIYRQIKLKIGEHFIYTDDGIILIEK
ncbi:MAG: hypothetical protein COU46_01075 [Candidatus Niyogibacteria bacterium CG10_big_fil_rev_8_21_14_0_10_42_19]|uniref:Glycosyltransferase RgtA/B/C/D-like domain-containing protein n=1 Tax=Candidatus Niyogibacteria bacterium CG10_big_fil_rev_8_21_14_0_10_42_19 TaxID=1974725 RepID=A0A2H0TG37_9BACT|nr:MAG: hypothetical protein COU46_01075 [Candidatus Niyogibacteria bacterium CG10_big_fil_rev_8_21_14_0_10_42_19]